MTSSSLRVLFLCTGNSARSILGEALLRRLASEGSEAHTFDAYAFDSYAFDAYAFDSRSAGARPTGRVHPDSLRLLQEDYAIDASGASSKSIEDLGDWQPDLVITVCDDAAETCPIWPGETAVAHWGLPDPAAVDDSAERMEVFRHVAEVLLQRLQRLVAIENLHQLDRSQLAAAVSALATPI
ncbi:MAG: arsenate reductase ArsC [Acidobacteriota bacterium]